jgi:hypothetical protein
MSTAGAVIRGGKQIGVLWLVALVISLYGAEDLQSWLRRSGAAERLPHTVGGVAAGLGWAARWTGLARLHRALEHDGSLQVSDAPVASRAQARTAASPPGAVAPAVRRVLLIGASTIQFHLGVELERALRARHPSLAVRRLGKLSTGLTRPDVFNWPAQLRELIAESHPDLVITNFGGNDAQGMVLAGGEVVTYGSPRWDTGYRERVREIVSVAHAEGARVVMLGMSSTRDPVLSRRMEHINALTAAVARAEHADYLSIWDVGADAGGHFQDVVFIDRIPTRTRLADGKHFSRAGAAYAAARICERLAQRYRFASTDAL